MADDIPPASRPHMPGYAVEDDPAGLLPWSHAVERLTSSHDYWIATVARSGAPAVTPVWGVWRESSLWFSCSRSSRKARNLARDPRVTATTSDPQEPVVIEGTAAPVTDPASIAAYTEESNAKYEVDYAVDFYLENLLVRIEPAWAFALVEADFTTSPTRWTFGPAADLAPR